MADLEKNDMKFKAFASADYRQVIQFNDEGVDDLNLISLDTGSGGNLLAGNYFSMNKNHLAGNLKKVITDFNKLEAKDQGDDKNYVLKINPQKDW